VNAEAFLSLYLKEIGVQAPISSFLGAKETAEIITPAPILKSEVLVEEVRYATQEAQAKSELIVAEATDSQIENNIPAQSFEETQQTNNQEQTTAVHPEPERIKLEYVEAEPAPEIVVMPEEEVISSNDLDALQIQAKTCQACELADSRNCVVFGSGNQTADLVFIGDAPSRDDDVEGTPFVGRSGELFGRMLASIQLSRDDVYVMNGVKCRPLHGRDPKPVEFASCERWLVGQLEMIQPRLICLLGRVVAEALLKTQAPLKELREGHYTFRGIPVIVIDHPSYLLRSQKHKQRAWKDLNRLFEQLQKLQSA